MKVIDKVKKDETTPTNTTKYRSPSSNLQTKQRNVTVNRYNDKCDEDREANPFTNNNKNKIENNYKSNSNNNQTRLNSTSKKKANEVNPSNTLMKTKK